MKKEFLDKLKSLSVLYAEDEVGIRENVADSLRYYFQGVYEANDGEEAYDIYLEKKPDIILTDIHMPKVDGIEFVKKIRAKDREVLIIIITAHTDKKYLMEAVELHMEKYIVKPINLEDLLGVFEKCIMVLNINKQMVLKTDPNYVYDYDSKELKYKNEIIKLNKKELSFIEFLLSNQCRTVVYDELQENIWGDDVMTDSAIRSMIFNLRKKLPTDIVKNLSGIGYRLE